MPLNSNKNRPEVTTTNQIPAALLHFVLVSVISILVGLLLGLACSFLYKHTTLSDYPHLETSILFSFCYLGYSTAEACSVSGIMALFVQAMVLSHYNSIHLSTTAHVASEHIFTCLATVAETAVFLYMGMGVFTGRFGKFDLIFVVIALCLCFAARLVHIFPLSWIANFCRDESNRISINMQCVLSFVGLRGAIAFALAMNMPGNHKDTYATSTLAICIFTTVVCGGFTERMLTTFEMKQGGRNEHDALGFMNGTRSCGATSSTFSSVISTAGKRPNYQLASSTSKRFLLGIERTWKSFDDGVLRPYFGGSTSNDYLGQYDQVVHGDEDSVEDIEVEMMRTDSDD
jgi:sodium/hydrogen exchanger 8